MESNGNSATKTKEIINKTNRYISNKTIYRILFVLIATLIGYTSKNIYLSKTQEYKNEIYEKVDDNIIDQFNIMLNEKLSTSLLVSSSLSKNTNIKKALLSNNSTILDMDQLLEEMRTKSEYVDIQAEVIDADGISFKRSWTHLSGDDLVRNDQQMAHLIKYPRVFTSIESSKYGLTFTNKIPIYEKDKFLGLFGVNIQFDALVDIFDKKGYKIVILLNKDDSKKIQQDLSHSKKFLNGYYIVNSNADNYLLRVVKQNDIDKIFDSSNNKYTISTQSDHLISKYTIKNMQEEPIARAVIFKNLDEIDLEDLNFMQQAHIVATVLTVLLVGFFTNYIYSVMRVKELEVTNEELTVVNEELKEKTDEMDFNDKKLDNLFNMQPNLMVMHNGKEVTKANKRFMGFFNRFGTFEGFKKKHKCVSELFEKYEAPNYIYEQYIEGEFWIEYMLQNPRRLYKVVMSINGDPHHFIIKFNEMDTAKHVADRIIIIALVDMTQDLVNYKTHQETSELLKGMKNINEKLELKEEKANSDISYEVKDGFEKLYKEILGENTEDIKIAKIDRRDIKSDKIIKVDGTLSFRDVETPWMFLITAHDSSVILNKISNGKYDINNDINKDTLDTAREFLYTYNVKLAQSINRKNFHDLTEAKYIDGVVEHLSKVEYKALESIYKISTVVEKQEINIYFKIADDIAPFLSMIVSNKPIEPTIVEDISSLDKEFLTEINNELNNSEEVKKEKENKKIENKKVNAAPVEDKNREKSAEKKSVEMINDNKKETELKPISVEEKIEPVENIQKDVVIDVKPAVVKSITPVKQNKVKDDKNNKNKLDPYLLVQNSATIVIKKLLGIDDVKFESMRSISFEKIDNNAGMLFTNKFKQKNNLKDLEWSLYIPAQTLSMIFNEMTGDTQGTILKQVDSGLQGIGEEIIKSMVIFIQNVTKKQLTMYIESSTIVNRLNGSKNSKIYDIGIVINKNETPIYMIREK